MTKLLLSLCLLAGFQAFAQPNLEVTSKDGSKKLLGQITRDALLKTPYSEWFQKEYDAYSVQKITVPAQKLSKTEIIIFMGTWCGDTRREVPRFLKILDSLRFPPENLRIICLDNSEGNYKQSPQHEEAGLGIHRVPTIIVRENKQETGRITESPVVSLEQDLLNILNRNKLKSHYTIPTAIFRWIESDQASHLEKNLNELSGEWKNQVSSSAELNTLGYVLKAKGLKKEAILVFRLNTLIYPGVANTYDSLGEAYKEDMNPELAARNYMKVLELKPNDQNALEKLKELEK